MKSLPQSEDVLADIGEKPVRAFALSVTRTRRDLRAYRDAFPQWVVDHSERGLANWISDRLWAHLVSMADEIPGMNPYEKGVTREITIGINYRFRVKRHDAEGNIASYATPTFLEFVTQSGGQLDGMEEIKLIAGYDWDKDMRDIGDAVISLRDGKDNVIWKQPLPSVDDEGHGEIPAKLPERPSPTGPTVQVTEGVGQKAKEPTEDE